MEDDEREAIAAFNGEDFRPSVPEALRWRTWRASPSPLTSDQLAALWRGIQSAAGLPDDPQAPYISAPNVPERVLANVVEWADALELDTPTGRRRASEAIGELTGELLRTYRGEMTTPASVSHLMVALVDPRPGERIYDPCFGTAGVLLDAATALWRRGRDVSAGEWSRAQRVPLFGVERNATSHLVGFVRLLLAGVRPALELGDALEREAAGRHHDQGFDCVLVDPPWGVRIDGAELYDFPIRGRSSETLFVQHALRSLRHGGRAVVVAPPGLLWRAGAEQELRAWMLTDFRVEAVVALPKGALKDLKSMQPTLLFVRRAPAAETVTFVQLNELPDSAAAARELAEALPTQAATPWYKERHSVPVSELLKADARFEVPAGIELEANDDLAGLRDEVEFVPLADVCEVVAGSPVRRDAIAAEPVGAPPIPVLRVSSIGDGVLADEGRYATEDLRERARDDQQIRQGDVLLSVDGTIGKVLHVRGLLLRDGRTSAPGEGAILALAQKGLAILRPRPILDARFLAAILESMTYQALLRRLARGATISHLSLKALGDVPVPVPPPSVQERLLRRLGEQPGDAVEALSLIVARDDDDALTSLLRDHTAFARLLAEGMPEEAELRSSSLEVLHALRDVRNRVAHAVDIEVPAQTHDWLMVLGSIPLASLRDLGNGFRFEALTATQALVRSALSTLGASTDLLVRQLRRLTERLLAWVDTERERAAGDFRVALTHDMRSYERLAGGAARTRLELRLEGTAHLEELTLRAPEVGIDLVLPKVLPGETVEVPATLPDGLEWSGHESGCWFPVHVEWSGTGMDARRAAGRVECSIGYLWSDWGASGPFEPHGDAVPEAAVRSREGFRDYGASPYITGDVVGDPERFVGRRDVLEDIRTHLAGGTKVILLEGNRRTGKTSILRQLQNNAFGLTDSWILCESSFQGTAGDAQVDGISTEGIFRMLIRDIGIACAKAGVPVLLPDMEPVTDPNVLRFRFARALNAYFADIDPYEALLIYVDMVIAAIAPRRLLIMLDEFDKLQVGIDNGVTSPQVPENIRNLLQTRPNVSAILTGSRRLKRLRDEYWSALFGFGHRIGIDPLTSEELKQLVQGPVAGRLLYEGPALREIVRLTACQPYLAQSLCARVFELAKRNEWRRIGTSEVEQAVARMVHDNEHFQGLWDYVGTERRRYLLWLCHQSSDGPHRVNAALLAQRLDERGVRASVDVVDDDLRFLVELELVELTNTPVGPQYAVAIPLMRRWMNDNIDPEAQRRRTVHEAKGEAPS
ncbi:MAG: N-6 DNA methylase [Polyangiaceae bacterium]